MKTYFISDLHLSDAEPGITKLFLEFMQYQAPSADAVYILGDFFNFWIGDDEDSNINNVVAESIINLTNQGVKCYFIHGNRDFLLGETYAKLSKLIILPEHHIIDLYGTPTMLCHGDTLCLDDIKYQKFRKIVHLKWLQKLFFLLPLKLRIRIGHLIRSKSNKDKKLKDVKIMDVNQQDSLNAFSFFNVTQIIHGHTHKQGIHTHHVPENKILTRIVLGDWGETSSILEVTNTGYKFNLDR